MRESLKPYIGADRLNFLCLIVTEMMGENSLARIPALVAGFESVERTLPPDVVQALRNVRIAGFAPGTLRELELMASSYRAHHRQVQKDSTRGNEKVTEQVPQRFVVEDDLSVRKQWTHIVPDDVTVALKALNVPLSVRENALRDLHDVMRPAEIEETNGLRGKRPSGNLEEGYSSYIAPLGFVPPDPPLYDINRVGRAPGRVSWEDLIAVARRFDALDVETGRQSPGEGAWFHRLHDRDGVPTARLLEPGDTGLVEADGIDLQGLKHLIGLPGAGKTTLLYLLAGYLDTEGYSACFLFPSIEVATGFIETLERYGIGMGLLSGQSDTSRSKHVLNFATALAGQNRGFGVSRPAARFFATNCALAGFASDEDREFPHRKPPCESVKQQGAQQKRARWHRCALCSVCGYQYSERNLIGARLWAGHVMSMDRKVSTLFSEFALQHFEFIARTFDVLIVDECDGAQSSLDTRGTPIMKLVGDADSLWHTLILDLHQPAARGRNAFVAGEALPALLEMTGRFGRATERLVGRITHFPPQFREYYAHKMVTSLSLLADMFADEPNEGLEQRYATRQALERIWDAAIKRVAFRHELQMDDAEEEEVTDIDRIIAECADLFGTDQQSIRDFHGRLLLAIERWERDGNDTAVRELAAVLRTAPNLFSPLDDETFFAASGFLVSVSLVVLQHFGLAPHLRLMSAAEMVSDNVFESRPSRDQMAILPESLVGRMSGVRYSISDEGNVNVSHVSFAGTPRLLPRRMIRLGEERETGGMAVLLTSATSMLEHSPSFHVATGPHYVLQRPKAGHGWKNSRYTFLPKNDPQTGKPLFFSGAKMSERERILTTIVDQLLRGGTLSDLESAIRQNDVVDGVGRKAAFVVNSYDQCKLIYDHIQANYPAWRERVRYLSRATIHGTVGDHAVTAAEVELLGLDPGWDLLIFPMNAIGRGVNIVYQFGHRPNHAMIGSVFFLTRPHPRGDSLQLIQGMVARESEAFDQQRFESTEDALAALRDARRTAVGKLRYLLRMPLAARRLGKYAKDFVADQMIIILQTIGRAMRGDCPAFVYFVDAAWAPNSAYQDQDRRDSPATSMLVMMQAILKECLEHESPAKRECYRNLYQSFAEPLSGIDNLHKD